MDKISPGKEASVDVTRESLIALSYSSPESILASKLLSQNFNGANLVEGIDCDRAEKYRSELISISNLQPPDMQGPAVKPGELKG